MRTKRATSFISPCVLRLQWGLWWTCTRKTWSIEAINSINTLIHTSANLSLFFFFSSASPVYIDIWAEHLSSFFLSPDCYVCVGSSGKYFPGDTKIFNSGFLLSTSTWHMPDCISLLISDVICDPNGHRRPEDCAEGYITAVVIPATLFSELVLLNNSRDEVQPMLRGI